MGKKQVLVILGPTSSGKTDVGIGLAKKLNGEIVSLDSRQVYRGLDIGTGKEPSQKSKVKSQKFDGYWEMDGVKVWMYDVVSPEVQYDVSRFVDKAEKIIEEILLRGKLPILVGGTGLYLRGLVKGFNISVPINEKLRKELDKFSLEQLKEKLKGISEEAFNEMNDSDRENPRRLVRKIEIVMGGVDSGPVAQRDWEVLKIGLFVDREELNRRIDERILRRLNQGMVEESEQLLRSKKITFERMRKLGLEYGILADYISGKISSKEELVRILQDKIHQYAKRQMTWFKKEEGVVWFDITEEDYLLKMEKRVLDWYN